MIDPVTTKRIFKLCSLVWHNKIRSPEMHLLRDKYADIENPTARDRIRLLREFSSMMARTTQKEFPKCFDREPTIEEKMFINDASEIVQNFIIEFYGIEEFLT